MAQDDPFAAYRVKAPAQPSGDVFAAYRVARQPASAEDFAPDDNRPLWQASTSLPGGTFAEKLQAAASVLGGEALGFAKGAAHSAIDIGQQAINAGLTGQPSSFLNPAYENQMLRKMREDTGYSNDPSERFGGGLETAAEVYGPVKGIGTAGIALAKSAPPLAKKVGVELATHLIPGGKTVRRAVRAVSALSDILDNAAAHSDEILAGVKNPSSKEEWLAAEMAKKPADLLPAIEARANAANVAPELPTPAPVAAPVEPAPVAAPPVETPVPPVDNTPQARAYFLKPQAVIDAEKAATARRVAASGKKPYFVLSPEEQAANAAATSASVAPTGELNVSDLPASWRSRVGQDLFPVTGAQGQDLLMRLREKIKNGMDVGRAIHAVSSDKSISTQVRAQLIRALSQTGAAR